MIQKTNHSNDQVVIELAEIDPDDVPELTALLNDEIPIEKTIVLIGNEFYVELFSRDQRNMFIQTCNLFTNMIVRCL